MPPPCSRSSRASTRRTRRPAAAGPYVHRDYLADLDSHALRGKRIGVWRGGGDVADVNAVTDAAIATLRAHGATVVDNVDLPGLLDAENAEFPALLTEFKHDINAYLAGDSGPHPADLAGLIDFDNQQPPSRCRSSSRRSSTWRKRPTATSPTRRTSQERAAATNGARHAIDSALAADHLDAIVAPTNGPAWVTNHQTGDDFTNFVSASAPAAIAGYPDLTVPAGHVDGDVLPIGLSFFGTAYSEPKLISMGYAFEQATHARHTPGFLPSLP